MSFDGDEENILLSILMYLQLTSTYSYNDYPKLKSLGFGVTDKPCFESSYRKNITSWCYCQFSISKTRMLLTKINAIFAYLHGWSIY